MKDHKTINIPDDMHRQLKRLAVDRDTTMLKLVADAIETVYGLPDVESPQTTVESPIDSTGKTRILYTDAGTKDNGGTHQSSRICVHTGTFVLVDELVGNKTNNEAKIMDIIKAIMLSGSTPTTIRSDSQLAVNLITGRWRGKKPHLKQLVSTVKVPKHIHIEWVSREINPAGWHLEQRYHI